MIPIVSNKPKKSPACDSGGGVPKTCPRTNGLN